MRPRNGINPGLSSSSAAFVEAQKTPLVKLTETASRATAKRAQRIDFQASPAEVRDQIARILERSVTEFGALSTKLAVTMYMETRRDFGAGSPFTATELDLEPIKESAANEVDYVWQNVMAKKFNDVRDTLAVMAESVTRSIYNQTILDNARRDPDGPPFEWSSPTGAPCHNPDHHNH